MHGVGSGGYAKPDLRRRLEWLAHEGAPSLRRTAKAVPCWPCTKAAATRGGSPATSAPTAAGASVPSAPALAAARAEPACRPATRRAAKAAAPAASSGVAAAPAPPLLLRRRLFPAMPRLLHVLLLLLLLLALLLLSRHAELSALLGTASEWLPLRRHASPALRRASRWRALPGKGLPVHLLRRLKLQELLLLRLLCQDDPASHAAESNGPAALANTRLSRRCLLPCISSRDLAANGSSTRSCRAAKISLCRCWVWHCISLQIQHRHSDYLAGTGRVPALILPAGPGA